MSVADNIIFDPTREELAVAEFVLAISVVATPSARGDAGKATSSKGRDEGSKEGKDGPRRALRLVSMRTIDPPSRLTPPGVPDYLNVNASVGQIPSTPVSAGKAQQVAAGRTDTEGVWVPPKGGVKRGVIKKMMEMVIREGGVADEVLDGLEGVKC